MATKTIQLDCYMNGANPGERLYVDAKEADKMVANGLAHFPDEGEPAPAPPTQEEHQTETQTSSDA